MSTTKSRTALTSKAAARMRPSTKRALPSKPATKSKVDKIESSQLARIHKTSAALFAAHGYEAVGIAEIGDAVQLGRGALYYHINSKEELLYEIVKKYIKDLVVEGSHIARSEQPAPDRVKALSRHLINTIANNLCELTVCFREVNSLTGKRHQEVTRLHSQYEAIWSKVVADGMAAGKFRTLPPVALKGILGMYFHSFIWLRPSGLNRPDEVADIFSDLVLRAIASR